MRSDGTAFEGERTALASALPHLFAHSAKLCGALRGPSWARAEPPVAPGPSFGTMSDAGYAAAFFDAMETDVVPGLVAIGLPEATAAYAALVRALD